MVLTVDVDESELTSSVLSRVVGIWVPSFKNGGHLRLIHLAPLDPRHTSNCRSRPSEGDIH